MEKLLLFLFIALLISVLALVKKKHPETYAKYTLPSKILWTTLSVLLMGFIGCSIWYMLARSNAGTETKVFYLLAASAILLLFAVLTVSTWKKKK